MRNEGPFLLAFVEKKMEFRMSIGSLLTTFQPLSFEGAWDVMANIPSGTVQLI